MESKELRIGNYVSHINDQIVGKPGLLIVRELRYNSARVEYQFEGKTRTSLVNYSELAGKPLTEDWLLKTNLILKWNEMGWRGKYAEFRIGGVLYFYFTDNNTIQQSSTHLWLGYLHQLQNLYFALTGKELEIAELTDETKIDTCICGNHSEYQVTGICPSCNNKIR